MVSEFAGRLHNDCVVECGLWDHSAEIDGTSISRHLLFTIFPRWRSRKWWCWVRTVFSLNVDYRKFLLRGQYWQRVFCLCLLSASPCFLWFAFSCMSCGIVIFTIVLSLYCNYLSSHVQNSIPQLPCSLIFSLKPTHFSTFPLYFPCSYKFPSFSG